MSNTKTDNAKKVVSPFEFAIRELVGDAEGYRPETRSEQEGRIEKKIKNLYGRIKKADNNQQKP